MTPTAISGVGTLWKQWLKMHRAWGAARAHRELYALNDRILKDIGLRRSDIDSLFR